MAAVKGPHISMPGRAFWGLVVQKGPWKSTYGDYLRAHEVPGGAIGGGIPVGGTGEGKRDSVMTPYQQNGKNPLPDPSEFATQSIVRPGESWFIKKSQPGMKLPTPLKAALTIKHSKERDYEDISHEKGLEPNIPPPPPDLSSTFLTEDRLLTTRKKGKLSVVTNVEMLPSPTMDVDTPTLPHHVRIHDAVVPTYTPPSLDLGDMFHKEAASLKRKAEIELEDQSKKMKSMKGPLPSKIETGPSLPYSRQSSIVHKNVHRMETKSMPKTSDEFPLNIKRKAGEETMESKKKAKVDTLKRKREDESRERAKKGKLMVKSKPDLSIQTTKLPPSKQSSTKVAGVRAERKSAPKKEDRLPVPRPRR